MSLSCTVDNFCIRVIWGTCPGWGGARRRKFLALYGSYGGPANTLADGVGLRHVCVPWHAKAACQDTSDVQSHCHARWELGMSHDIAGSKWIKGNKVRTPLVRFRLIMVIVVLEHRLGVVPIW